MGTKGKTWLCRRSKPLSLSILAYRKEHPDVTLEAIGQEFGVSRQTVWYFIHRLEYNTKRRGNHQ